METERECIKGTDCSAGGYTKGRSRREGWHLRQTCKGIRYALDSKTILFEKYLKVVNSKQYKCEILKKGFVCYVLKLFCFKQRLLFAVGLHRDEEIFK